MLLGSNVDSNQKLPSVYVNNCVKLFQIWATS